MSKNSNRRKGKKAAKEFRDGFNNQEIATLACQLDEQYALSEERENELRVRRHDPQFRKMRLEEIAIDEALSPEDIVIACMTSEETERRVALEEKLLYLREKRLSLYSTVPLKISDLPFIDEPVPEDVTIH